jgi:hypothetical protein
MLDCTAGSRRNTVATLTNPLIKPLVLREVEIIRAGINRSVIIT